MSNERGASWVLLHGMLGDPSVFAPLCAALEQRRGTRRMVSPVLPGHGPRPFGLAARSFDQALSELAARLPAGPLMIAGYSLGARLALALAAREPGRFRRVVAIGAHLGIEAQEERAARRAWERGMAELARERSMNALVDSWERLDLFATQARLPAPIVQRQREARLAHDPTGIAWAFEVLGTGSMPLLRPRLLAAHVPISWVAGALDEKFAAIARAAEASCLGPALIIPGAGHNVPLEAPEALADVLVGFEDHTEVCHDHP